MSTVRAFTLILVALILSAVINAPGLVSSSIYANDKTELIVGYLPAVKGEVKDRQGLSISGAITMALEEINNDITILPNVTLVMRWNDTRGDQVIATRAITEMICDGVSSIFGPEGVCHVEAIIAQSRNIPMFAYVRTFLWRAFLSSSIDRSLILLQKCSDYKASKIPTFARTEPPDTQVSHDC